MKEYNYKIDSVSRELTARVIAKKRHIADELLMEELKNWSINNEDYDIILDHIVDLEFERVDIEENC